jgi:hypothetical protein
MATVRSALGDIFPNVIIEESGEDIVEITDHPVQQGASITDHAYKKPVILKLTLGYTDKTESINTTYAKLIELQDKRGLLDVMTGKRIYKNMMIRSLSQTTDAKTNSVLIINFELKEIIMVPVQTSSVPARAYHANAAKTGGSKSDGTKSTSAVGDGETKKKSALRTFSGS